jgi:hypothetical protein
MTSAGWIFMLGSLGFVLTLTFYCFYRVLAKPTAAEHMHAPLDIDTHDKNT